MVLLDELRDSANAVFARVGAGVEAGIYIYIYI